MTIEHPTFPTPEEERHALLLYQALRNLADIDSDVPATVAPAMKKPGEAGS